MAQTVGLIGLGNAGSAIAHALSGRVNLVGYDLSPERTTVLADPGAVAAASVDHVA